MTSSHAPFQTHRDEREDGRREEGEVEVVRELAEQRVQVPQSVEVVVGLQRNAEQTDEQVGQSEARDEQVGDAGRSEHDENGDDHQQVPCGVMESSE